MNAEPALRAENVPLSESQIEAKAQQALDQLSAARKAIGSAIFGQELVVEEALVTILSGGHALFVGAPGLAKTLLVDTLGKADMSTFTVLKASNAWFGAQAKKAVPKWSFTPAVKTGCKVPRYYKLGVSYPPKTSK